jgi:hypothetical protein
MPKSFFCIERANYFLLTLYNHYLSLLYIEQVLKDVTFKFQSEKVKSIFILTLIPLSGVGTTCFHHVVIKIRQLFLRPAACLMSTLLETAVGANDRKYSREQ